jgi:hypothetical protein
MIPSCFRIYAYILLAGVAVIAGCGSDDNSTGPEKPKRFDYSDTEAVHLTLQVDPTFLPDTTLYKTIHEDLHSIRDTFPDMNKVEHFENRPAGRITVQLTAAAAAAYEAGTYHGLDSLNNLYDTAHVIWYSQYRQMKINFALPYHSDSIAEIYNYANGVESASAISIGTDGSRIFVDLPEYEFQFRWGGDCIPLCSLSHIWQYEVTGSSIILIEESGDTLPDGF